VAQSLRIVLPGGSGQLGRLLARHFHESGHAVTVIARRDQRAAWKTLAWDGATIGSWAAELNGADVVINLAGRSVDCRYTDSNRREIMQSRVASTRAIAEAVSGSKKPPTLWINASTATIYRHATDRRMDEATGEFGGNEPGARSSWDFSIDVALAWEKALFEADAPATRRVALRSAMVMSPDRGGVFDTLLRLVRFGLGGKAGSGEQYVSWIHDADFIAAIEFLIAHPELDGPVNVTSPGPLPNAAFMRDLRRAWGARIGLPATTWMLEIGAFLLQTETELILKSRRVVPSRLLEAGFSFRFPEWSDAARDLARRWRA
jgi:uncharacterized protein (TIGR01777 family)